ncbi:NRPS [Purpureocillium takamizusanense]|uniref:NRPS n=1 Tax=Purpureocillium takamizusanense TaxID=2060973 RepID=A0A9Q8VFR0_9HYPO|nr:NRPS [Purpureocillium takamizusanense]UNI23721.1 NRPS [Purpureocillium takamizusanense]
MLAVSEFLVLFELCTVLDKGALDIDLDTGFITNGGDSLGAVALAAACKAHGLSLPREKILRSQTLRGVVSNISSPHVTDPTQAKSYLLSKLGSDATQLSDVSSTSSKNTTPSFGQDTVPINRWPLSENTSHVSSVVKGVIVDTPPDTALSGLTGSPLTEMQLHFIHGSLRQPGTNFITHSETYETRHVPILKEAWRMVIESEPIFNQDIPRHHTMNAGPTGFNWTDAMTQESGDKHTTETDIGSFFRVAPVNSSSGLSTITWTVHHSMMDGFSASLLFDKVLRIANGEQALPAGPSFLQVTRELDLFRKTSREFGTAYWAGKQAEMSKAQHELLLPAALPHDSYAGSKTVSLDITDIAQGIQSRAKAVGVTPASIFNTAWALTLAQFADAGVVSFGAVLCGRSLVVPGALDVIGPLLNTLPLTINVAKEMTTEELLRTTFDELVELEEYQWTTSDNGFSRAFETALSVQVDVADHPNRHVRPHQRETRQEHEVPLGITVDPQRKASFDYHVNRFSRENVECLAKTYRHALERLLVPTCTVEEVVRPLLPASSTEMLHRFGNCSSSTLTSSIKEDLVTLFERQSREIPDNVAIEKGCDKMTYQEMDRIASKIASRLSRHIKHEEVVCVYSDRSILWLCAIFGILKAGGVYCSMDPTVPQEVRDRNFGLSGAKVFIIAKPCQLPIVPKECPISFTVQSTMDSTEFEPAHHRLTASPSSPAYVCFTSGSTGTPKGVLCAHAGLVAFQSSLDVRLFAGPGRKIAHIMSVAFDGSIHEVFSALTHGATLVLPSGSDPFGHLHTADSAILTPSLARLLDPDEFERLKWVYFVGEPVSQAVCDRWASVKQLYNMYGPTEGTCGATIKRLLPGQPVTIGVPNPTTRIYILNADRALSPPGAIGELYLAGVQVAGGYLGLPQQTQQRFLPDNIWSRGVGEKMYKTGDRGYWTEDGEISLLGRRDREIKLRGYRLDMGDLEIRIARAYPSLQAVAVAQHKDQLIAMVQPENVSVVCLRQELGKALPQYAMPHIIVTADKLPVTGAGKVDYKAVAGVASHPRNTQTHVDNNKLVSSAEVAVAQAYKAALQLAHDVEITASSNFLELGGHSLRQLELLRQLSTTFGVQLSLKMILGSPTVRELAKAITRCINSTPALPLDQKYPVSEERATPIEVEWMRKYETSSGSSSFNVCFSSLLDVNVVHKERLIEAWNMVLARHPLLACHYAYRGADDIIRINPGYVPRVQTPCSFDLWAEANRPFSLELEQPVRVFVTDDRLTVVLSHIVADYTALSLLMREASDAYNGKLLDAAPRSYSLADVWYGTPSEAVLDFWTKYLWQCPENPHPFGGQINRSSYSGTSALSLIHTRVFEQILGFSVSANVTLQQITMACVALCLDQSESRTDILLGVPHINRDTADDLDTFGLFLQPLPVRIRHDADSVGSLMDSVKTSSQMSLAHAMPWHQLLGHLGMQAEYPNHPLFDVMVTMHDFRHTNELDMKIAGLEPSFVWAEGAKFKLLCEFTALPNGKLLLRLEYDAAVVSGVEIGRLKNAIPLAMHMLATGSEHDEVKIAIRDGPKLPSDLAGIALEDTKCFFGKSLEDI